MVILSRGQVLLAIMLYEQLKHLERISLHPNSLLLDNEQRANQSTGLILFASLWHVG